MEVIRYESHSPPGDREALDNLALDMTYHAPGLTDTYKFGSPENFPEHCLRNSPPSAIYPPDVRRQYEAWAEWIPPAFLAWWRPRLKQEGLNAQTNEYWLSRCAAFETAWHRNKPIGGGGILDICWTDRRYFYDAYDAQLREIRGLYVAKALRGTEAKVAETILNRLLDKAHSLGEAETFASTTNPIAARLFARAGGSPDALYKNPLRSQDLAGIACWRRDGHATALARCEECPLQPGTTWWWKTSRRLPAPVVPATDVIL